jgi:hypothetical protein
MALRTVTRITMRRDASGIVFSAEHAGGLVQNPASDERYFD